MTLPATTSVTFLQDSRVGFTPLTLPDGRVIDPCGLALALASLSARQVKALGLRTSGIYGPPGSTSSRSESLQRFLESRLLLRLPILGSIYFTLTWKAWVTPSGVSRSRLRQSARYTDANATTGWRDTLPTPSGTSNHGKNHVAGRLDEWGGSSNPFRGTSLGRVHCPAFELWAMGYPEAWAQLMPPATPSSRRQRRSSSAPASQP